MAEPVVTVHVEWIGHQAELWCRDCLLSVGARAWYTTTVRGDTRLHETRFCTDCGGRNVDAAEADVEDEAT